MRWLALDVGARRIGVALSDPDERVVTPCQVLTGGGPQTVAEHVRELVSRWGVEGVVVGEPVTRAGASRGQARVATVVEALRRFLTVPVETFDERGTTREAMARLAAAGVGARRRKQVVDAVAAAALLEAFLSLRKARAKAQMVDGPCAGC